MRGFETLLAASVAAAGIAQIGVMVARSSHHVDAIPVEPSPSDCCQYRAWPVENSFWTFPFPSRFHQTTQGLDESSSAGPFSRPALHDDPSANLVYSPAGRAIGPEVNATFPWTDFADQNALLAADASNQAPQVATTAGWVGEGPAAPSHRQSLTSTPTLSLFLADPGSGGEALQNPEPAVVDSPVPPTPDMIPLPDPDDLPQSQVVGDLGGSGGDLPDGMPTPSDVPEPAALIVVLTSLLGLAAARHPRRA